MNENLKVCKQCNAVNDADALFCRQCGAKFEDEVVAESANVVEQTVAQPVNEEKTTEKEQTVENQQPVQDQSAQAQYSQGQTEQAPVNNQQAAPQFQANAISEQEFYAYIGKNQKRFMPKFREFFGGKKASFSPLVFLLTWLVSPIAGAFWFFHRKAYKIGSLLLAIGLVLTIITAAISVAMMNETTDVIKDYIAQNEGTSWQNYSSNSNAKLGPTASSDDELEKFLEEFGDDYGYDYDDNKDYDYYDDYNDGDDNYNPFNDSQFRDMFKDYMNIIVRYVSVLSIISILQLALAIVMGIFAKYWYFKDAVNKISAIKQQNPTPSSINQIAQAGGTSCVAWVIIMVVYIISMFVFAFGLISNVVYEFLPYIGR